MISVLQNSDEEKKRKEIRQKIQRRATTASLRAYLRRRLHCEHIERLVYMATTFVTECPSYVGTRQ